MINLRLWNYALNELGLGRSLCLLLITDATGSTPNGPGAAMLLDQKGRMLGTIGGGNAEHMLVETARGILQKGFPRNRVIHLRHDGSNDAGSSGMICDGSQTFLIRYLDKADLPWVRELCSLLREDRAVRLVMDPGPVRLVRESNTPPINRWWESAGPNCSEEEPSDWCYELTLGMHDHVYIVGGGHVSLALSRVLDSLGFSISVLDHRDEVPTMQANQWAMCYNNVDLGEVASAIPEGPRSWVCIMTFGHQFDEAVLRLLVNNNYRYLGMLGSKCKVKNLREHLLAEGISAEALARVHSPIGLEIGSVTPEEIAISIAAQMIQMKRQAEEPTFLWDAKEK